MEFLYNYLYHVGAVLDGVAYLTGLLAQLIDSGLKWLWYISMAGFALHTVYFIIKKGLLWIRDLI